MATAAIAPAAVRAPAAEDFGFPSDLFILPDGDRYLLFAPLTLGVVSVNESAARRLQRVRDGEVPLTSFAPHFIAELADAGILVPREYVGLPVAFPQKQAYDPAGITLFLTTRCSLACTYCYASGGDRPRMMTWETARGGLDWIIRHAESKGRSHVSVMFHGGGEVTIAWPLLKQCISHLRDETSARGMTFDTSAGLNGVMTGPLLEWVIANINGATVSLDGLPEIHNAQRPLVTGKDSFEVIARALRRMDEAGFHYGLRVTVTRLAMTKLVESVEFMCQNFRAQTIQLEPVYSSGRALTNAMAAPDPHEFVQKFRLARDVARAHGRELKYSGARFGTISNKFCSVSDDLLALTPEGFLSSCYEVGESDDPRSETFFYGRLNTQTRDLDVDMKKVRRLRTLTVENKTSCDTCFCKYSCGGECSAKLALAGNAWDANESPRCIINRELTLDQMREYLANGGHPPVLSMIEGQVSLEGDSAMGVVAQ